MSPYARPPVVERMFRDRSGAVIPYGDRWGGGSPPEDAYSVVSNLERFAPLHTVAEALLEHLLAAYDVAVVDDVSVAADVAHLTGAGVVRAVRLTPSSSHAAALTVVLTHHPAVHVHAGLLHDAPFPGCACDACDTTWDSEADDLERLVLAVVGGRFGERVARWPRRWVHHAVASEHGGVTSSGSERTSRIPARRLRAARRVLRPLGGGPWRPWPLQSSAG